MQRLRCRLVHAVRQLREDAMNVLKCEAQQYDVPTAA
jgi:hypothetical protein